MKFEINIKDVLQDLKSFTTDIYNLRRVDEGVSTTVFSFSNYEGQVFYVRYVPEFSPVLAQVKVHKLLLKKRGKSTGSSILFGKR